MSDTTALTDSELFFFVNAPFSYDPVTETPAKGLTRTARTLAAAEAEAKSRGWWINITADPDVMEDDVDSVGMVARGEMVNLEVTLWGPPTDGSDQSFILGDPVVLASLCGVVVPHDRDPYIRVVAAQLAAEALEEASA
jgi:hypothetical protein